MIVRLIKPWQFRKVGTVFSDMPDGAANTLIKRGVAEAVVVVKEQPKKMKGIERVRG
jgi:hypothetical protein